MDKMTILGVELEVAVLDNGQRVIEASSFWKLIEAFESPERDMTEDEAVALAKVVRGVD